MGIRWSSARTRIRQRRQRSPLSKLGAHARRKWYTAGHSPAATSLTETTGDWKRILGPKAGFKTPTTADRTLQGMEAMHTLRTGQGRLLAYGARCSDAVIVAKAFDYL